MIAVVSEPRELVRRLERSARSILRESGVPAERQRRDAARTVGERRGDLYTPRRQRDERVRLGLVRRAVEFELVDEAAAEVRREHRHQAATPALRRPPGLR